MEYYGLDWALMALGLATKYLTIHQSRWHFLTSILACIAGFGLAIMAQQWGVAVFNLILIAMSVQGIFVWSKLQAEQQAIQKLNPQPQTA